MNNEWIPQNDKRVKTEAKNTQGNGSFYFEYKNNDMVRARSRMFESFIEVYEAARCVMSRCKGITTNIRKQSSGFEVTSIADSI